MQPTCVICNDTNGVELVETSEGSVLLCGVHNNPAAIADLEARHGIPARTDLPIEDAETPRGIPLASRAKQTSD
jgi:hypothetical protein